jgi:serine/threonine protein kinase
MRTLDIQMREFEVLKRVEHENIVKVLAIEEEQESRGKAIVMELCTGGSRKIHTVCKRMSSFLFWNIFLLE